MKNRRIQVVSVTYCLILSHNDCFVELGTESAREKKTDYFRNQHNSNDAEDHREEDWKADKSRAVCDQKDSKQGVTLKATRESCLR